MISALIAFETARLDEDEAAARAAGGRSWRQPDPERTPGWVEDDSDSIDRIVVYDEGAPTAEQAAHIARHDPARVLREAAVKRARLAELLRQRHYWNPLDEYYSCSQATADDNDEPGSGCSDPDRRGQPCDCGRDATAERTLRAEVSVWDDHPDYRPEWKP